MGLGAILDADAYALSVLSVPYVVVTIGMMVIIGYLLFTRGNPLVRTSLLAVMLSSFPYTFVAAYRGETLDCHLIRDYRDRNPPSHPRRPPVSSG